MSHFPMFRLATLLARQLSTPIASYIKVYTRRHPRYSRSLCMGIGRAFHTAELRFRLWTLGLKQPRQLPPISDETALESGAYLLGEMVLFGIGGLIVVWEVNRQANKQDDKVLDAESQWLALLVSLEELQRELVLQQQDLDRMQDALRALAAPPPPSNAHAPAPAPFDVTPPDVPATSPSKARTPPLPDECLPPRDPTPPRGNECLVSSAPPPPFTEECLSSIDLTPPDNPCPDLSLPPTDEYLPPADLSSEPADECPPPPEEPC